MSDPVSPRLLGFSNHRGGTVLRMDKDVEGIIEDWNRLRASMARDVPEFFSRDEWAYLIQFIDKDSLDGTFTSTFGTRVVGIEDAAEVLVPRGRVVLWSPNNVSLLAPLTLIMVSITGSQLKIKLGSRSVDLCTPFIDWILNRIESGPLFEWIDKNLEIARFDRGDPRNSEWSRWADVRIAFGSDAGCEAVAALPTSDGALTYLFSNRSSQMWCTMESMDDTHVDMLIRVFSIYGTAGCTSPRIVTMINGTTEDCMALAERLANRWPSVLRGDVEMHHASQNILSGQIATARGWSSINVDRRAAVIAVGDIGLPSPEGHLTLAITYSTIEGAIDALPEEIQTIGYALPSQMANTLEDRLSDTGVKRFVPVGEMHHFGPVWDGMDYWRGMFREE